MNLFRIRLQAIVIILFVVVCLIIIYKRAKNAVQDISLAEPGQYLLGPKRYNTPVAFEVLPGGVYTIPSNTAHRIDYAILDGTARITEGGGPAITYPAGNDVIEVDELITVQVKFEALTGTIKGRYYI